MPVVLQRRTQNQNFTILEHKSLTVKFENQRLSTQMRETRQSLIDFFDLRNPSYLTFLRQQKTRSSNKIFNPFHGLRIRLTF